MTVPEVKLDGGIGWMTGHGLRLDKGGLYHILYIISLYAGKWT